MKARYVVWQKNGYYYCADTEKQSTACAEVKREPAEIEFGWLKTLVKKEGGCEYWN